MNLGKAHDVRNLTDSELETAVQYIDVITLLCQLSTLFSVYPIPDNRMVLIPHGQDTAVVCTLPNETRSLSKERLVRELFVMSMARGYFDAPGSV